LTAIGPAILVVDDNEAFRQGVTRALERAGYEVVAVSNGPDALFAASRQRFAAMLLDIRMPKMSGFDVLKLIKRLCPDLPVIMISGLADPDLKYHQAATRGGVAAYLSKPCEIQLLRQTIARVLQGQKVIAAPDTPTGKQKTSTDQPHLQEHNPVPVERFIGLLPPDVLEFPIGHVIGDDNSPQANYFRFLLEPGTEIRPGTFVASIIHHNIFDNSYIIGKVVAEPSPSQSWYTAAIIVEAIDGIMQPLSSPVRAGAPVFPAPESIVCQLRIPDGAGTRG